MKKLNNKGFALVETLIVSVFVMGIFTMMFSNFFPMIGEYEKRERYDDIDSVYNTYLVKKVFESNSAIKSANSAAYTNYRNSVNNNSYAYAIITCDFFGVSSISSYKNYCRNLFANLKVRQVFLTSFSLNTTKKDKMISAAKNTGFGDYIKSLPNYTGSGSNPGGKNYRIIVMYEHVINNESTNDKSSIYSYSTMGVDF